MEALDRVTELSVLYEISAIPTRLTKVGQVGALVVDKVIRLLGNDVAIFYLHRPETAALYPQASRGVLLARLTELPLDSLCQAVAHALAGKRPLSWRRGDSADMPDLSGMRYTVQAVICAPVRTGDELLGLIYAARLKDRPFTASEQSLFGVLADRAASAIENVRLIESGQRRTMRLQTAAEVSRAASSILDPDELLPQVVDLIRERFNLCYAGIFLVDEAGKHAVLQAGTGEAGRKMLEAGHKLEVGGESMIGWCVANRQARIALGVGKEAVRFDNPLLPETRSEMALPLVSRGEVIGAMTIQSAQEAAFSEEDAAVLQTMADQLANAIQNARLFRQTQESLQEVKTAHRHYLREEWEKYAEQRSGTVGYEYDLNQVVPLQEMPPLELTSALREGCLVTQSGGDGREGTALLAPITLGGEPIGVLGFEEPERPRRWTPDETALIEAVTSQVALALENRRLFEQTQEALTETEALYSASWAIGAATSSAEVGQALMNYAATSGVDAVRVLFFEHDEQGRPVQMVMHEGWTVDGRPTQPYGTRLAMEDYPLTDFMNPNKPVVVEDVLTDERANEMVRTLISTISGLRSFAMVPITVGNRCMGTIFAGRDEPGPFAEELVRGYWTLAGQAATALDNLRLLEETRRHLEHITTLYEIGQEITSTLDLDVMLQTIVDDAARLAGCQQTLIALLDVEKQELLHLVGHGYSKEHLQSITFEELWHGLTGWVMREKKPTLTQDILEDERETDEARERSQQMPRRSVAVAPLMVKGQVIGTLTGVNPRGESVLTREDLDVLVMLASQAAIAIENVRLFEESRIHAEELSVLNELARALTARLSVEEVLEEVHRGASRLLDTTNFYIGLYDPERNDIRFAFDVTSSELDKQITVVTADEGFAGYIVRHRTSVLVQENPAERLAEMGIEMVGELALSYLGVPLLIGDRVLGVMAVQSFTTPRVYDEHDQDLLSAIASQTAIALQNAYLFEETQRSARQWEALTEVGRAIGSILNLDEVLRLMLERLKQVVPYDSVSLWLREGETMRVHAVVGLEDQEGVVGLTVPIQEDALFQELVHTRQSLTIADAQQDERFRGLGGTEWVRSWLGVPLLSKGQVIGLLTIDKSDPGFYTAERAELAFAFGQQASMAIENARLFEETQATLSETEALYHASRAIVVAQTPGDVLRAFTDHVVAPEMGRCVLALIDPTSPPGDPIVRIEAAWEPGEERPAVLGNRWNVSQIPLIARMITEPMSISDVSTSPEMDEISRHVFLNVLDIKAVAVVPLLIGERHLGWLLIESLEEPYDFSAREVRLYQTLAGQAAIALESMRLFEETQRRAVQLAVASEVARDATAILDVDQLLDETVHLISERFGFYHAGVFLVDNERKYAVLRAASSEGGRRMLARGHRLEVGKVGMVGYVTGTGEPRIALDVGKDAAHFVNPDLPETRSEMTLPLRVRGEVIGALDVQSTEEAAFTDEDVATLQTMADQLANAIENARLFAEIEQTAERLKELDRLKSQFLANMSHELRTPLNSVIGFSRVILKGIDGPLTDLQRTDLQAIYESGQHLLGLINDILDISKIEAGKMELALEDVDLTDVIKGVMSTAIALVKDKPIKLQQTIAPHLPTVRGDVRRIREIILNLVANAAKFTEEGFIHLTAEATPAEVVISVADSGIGISPDKMDTIFEPFTQVDASSTRRAGGTGLGLSISKHFVEMHGGRLWVESTLGEGSTFYFTLPIEPLSPPIVEEKPKKELQIPKIKSGQKLVLCVDDDEGVITLFRRYLGKQGYQVTGLTDGIAVVEQARQLQPFAITLDVLMPNKDGWQIIQELKTDPETRHIPVIMCTIISEEERGLSLGASDYLVKPILEQDLLAALERLDQQAGHHRVLVVDDQPEDRHLLRRMIESQKGYEVVEAAGGQEALALIRQTRPHIIVLDLMMPEVDGFAVLETLKIDEATRSIPIIVVTAKDLTQEERDLLSGRVEALLQKGLYNRQELLADVAAALKRLTSHGG